jgi:hypothetical protein
MQVRDALLGECDVKVRFHGDLQLFCGNVISRFLVAEIRYGIAAGAIPRSADLVYDDARAWTVARASV